MRAAQGVAPLRNRLLAVIARHQSGQLGAAIDGYRELLREDPRQFDAWRLLGAALLADGRHGEAVDALDRAAEIREAFGEVWALRGEALGKLQRRDEAIASFERALALEPKRPEAWAALGLLLHEAQRDPEALAAFERSVTLQPNSSVAWANRGLVLAALKRYDEALQSQERALVLAPDSAQILANRGDVLHELQRHADALESGLDRALALAPDKAAIWSARAAPLRALGRLDEALRSSERALSLDPADASIWAQHGALLVDLLRFGEAAQAFERAVSLAPAERNARFNLGALQLLLGDFERGWDGYEWRGKADEVPTGPPPMWDGASPLAGKTLLLQCEQGIGDTIQFSRYARLLAQGGARVILAVPPPLVGLLRTLEQGIAGCDGGGRLEVLTDGDMMPALDVQLRLLSVPQRLKVRLEDIPGALPYLWSAPARERAWRERLQSAQRLSSVAEAAPPFRIGLIFSGNPAHANDRHRSIALQRFEALAATGAQLHLLQKDLRPDDLPWLARLGVIDHRAELTDFVETAALVCCMDLIVSVDTSVAHLAGALGRPLCLLLPANPDWRWMLGRADTPWYPSARLFRQEVLGDWEKPLGEVVRFVQERLREHAAGPAATLAPNAAPGATPPSSARSRAAADPQQVPLALASPAAPGAAAVVPVPTRDDAGAKPNWWEDNRLLELERLARDGRHDAAHQFNLGLRYLTLGRFERGWEYYEWRMCVPALFMAMPEAGEYWSGAAVEGSQLVPQPLAGRTILLCHEQGLGDVIQFARFVPWLAQRGARVVLGVPAVLQELLRSVPGVGEVVSSGAKLPHFDLKCLLLSCAQRLGVDETSIPAVVPYLAPPAAALGAWSARLGPRTARLRIGIAASGNPKHDRDAERSIPLARFAFLRELDAELHLLQRELRPADEAALAELGVVDHRAQLDDLAQTAALIACLDAVVSVDTAVAHLAGAMDVPLRLLLAHEPDWRWMLERVDSPWYPSARLYRQSRPGDWSDPFARLLADLRGTAPRAGAGSLALRPPAQYGAGAAAAAAPIRSTIVRPPDLAAQLKAGAEALRGGRIEQAAEALRYVLLYDKKSFHGQRLMAAVSIAQRRYADALAACDAALAEVADSDEVLALRAQAQRELGDLDAAIADWSRAVHLQPASAKHWNSLGLAQLASGAQAAARHSFEQALTLAPQEPVYHLHRAQALLALGEMAEGWREFEWRLRVPELNMVLPLDAPRWDGREALDGRTILVSAEQGLGDTIQFSRCAALLARRGARVVLGVQAPLGALLRTMDAQVQVIGEGDALPPIDRQCWLLSLPHLLGLDAAALPDYAPRLVAPPAAVGAWRARLPFAGSGAGAPRRIGLICSGSASHANDAQRSIALAQFAPLRSLEIELHLVQDAMRAADEPWLDALGIHDHRAQLRDFADTAGLMSCLDAVISVDTAGAHLAGALGLPLYLLLPRSADWRWRADRSDTPWYPSARLLRQRTPGDWDEVMQRLVAALATAET